MLSRGSSPEFPWCAQPRRSCRRRGSQAGGSGGGSCSRGRHCFGADSSCSPRCSGHCHWVTSITGPVCTKPRRNHRLRMPIAVCSRADGCATRRFGNTAANASWRIDSTRNFPNSTLVSWTAVVRAGHPLEDASSLPLGFPWKFYRSGPIGTLLHGPTFPRLQARLRGGIEPPQRT